MKIKVLMIVCMVLLSGCTTMESIHMNQPVEVGSLKIGDRLHIFHDSNQAARIMFYKLDDGVIYGQQMAHPFRDVTVAIDNISIIKRERVNPASANLAVAAVSLVVVPLSIVVGAVGIE